jgi:pyruvate formate lyase activating enzyme
VKEAAYFKPENDKLRCLLCPRECLIKENSVGFCRQRINKNNRLYAKNYAEVASYALDPIEKKPLYHFYPGTQIFSLGCNGCNFGCVFCQNWQISQVDAPTETLPPQKALKLAIKYNSIGIAYTYSEPMIWYEYVLETAKLAKKHNLKNVLVTNGFINERPLLELLPYIDAANIDLKSISSDFYKIYCKAELDPVLKNIKIMHKHIFIELTNLIIPTLNDSEEELKKLIDFVGTELSENVPLHFSRYFPHYKLKIEPTPLETLKLAYELASSKLKYVYLGNIWDNQYNTTYCPNCKKPLIIREGYYISLFDLVDKNKCKYCYEEIDIID